MQFSLKKYLYKTLLNQSEVTHLHVVVLELVDLAESLIDQHRLYVALDVVCGGIPEAVRDHHQYKQEKRVKRNLQIRDGQLLMV